MKTPLLIIALLLSVTTYAQDTIHPNSYKEYDFAMYQLGMSYYYDIEYLLSRNRYLVITELTLHKAYLDYCYADSTEVTHDWYLWNGDTVAQLINIDPGFSPGYLGRWSIYHHKPVTFEGYVEWLSEMLKQNK